MTRHHRPEGLNHRNVFLPFLEAESLGSGSNRLRFSWGTPWPAGDCLLTMSPHGLSSAGPWRERERALSIPLCIRPLMTSWGSHPQYWSKPDFHPKALHSNTITVEVRLQYMNLCGRKQIFSPEHPTPSPLPQIHVFLSCKIHSFHFNSPQSFHFPASSLKSEVQNLI